MSGFEHIERLATAPFTRLFEATEQTYWATFIGALAVAAAYYAFSRRGRKTSARGMMRYLFPKKLMKHPSTTLDAKLYIFGSIYITLQSFVLIGASEISEWLLTLMEKYIGPAAQPTEPSLVIGIITPLAIFLALEFGYWLAHYTMHKVPFMWELHKVHHNAEVLTPLTEWRQHPIENLLFTLMPASFIAITYAILLWSFGEGAQIFPYWSTVLILLVFYYTLLHLRHTHIKMSAPGLLKYVLNTPAHHHIHHSIEPRHFTKNLGYCTVLWDSVFGTLYLPEKGQRITMGLGDEQKEWPHTLRTALIKPLTNSARMLAKRK